MVIFIHPPMKGNQAVKTMSKNQLKKISQANNALERQIQAFDDYYSSYYTAERWNETLKPGLLADGKHVAMVNKRADQSFALNLLGVNDQSTAKYLPEYFDNLYIKAIHLNPVANENTQQSSINEEALLWPSPSLPTSLDSNSLCCYYPLDAASLLPIILLDLKPNHSVLDVCAAPGGKSLAISQFLNLGDDDVLHQDCRSGQGDLTCNDISPDRKLRLQNVLRKYIPRDCIQRTQVTQSDASSSGFVRMFGRRKFDRILLDAPCSSERHLLKDLAVAMQNSKRSKQKTVDMNSIKDFMSWSPGRCKNNAERQFSLLWNALKLCEFGGKVVYSTCALSPLENDQLVQKLLRKLSKKNERRIRNKSRRDDNDSDDESDNEDMNNFVVEVLPIDPKSMPFGAPTEIGWQILPDNNDMGWGPIYCTVLTKLPATSTNAVKKHDDTEEPNTHETEEL